MKELKEKTNFSKQEIEKILEKSVKLGTIVKNNSDYRLLTLLPGIFELYYIRNKDSQENKRKVAEIY